MGCDDDIALGIGRSNTVSIHAPAWGATSPCISAPAAAAVSIHAPAWGATTRPVPLLPDGAFQSTHPHGVRQIRPSRIACKRRFQSTHPHGVRLYRKKPVIYLGFGVRFREPLRKARALCYMSEQYLPISQLQDLREPPGEINIT